MILHGELMLISPSGILKGRFKVTTSTLRYENAVCEPSATVKDIPAHQHLRTLEPQNLWTSEALDIWTSEPLDLRTLEPQNV
ncbi:hypothetical protein F2P79_023375 [Pimephales promelas]|nr:hypothetical protein F2P79_023375 [Pimephales promelas]